MRLKHPGIGPILCGWMIWSAAMPFALEAGDVQGQLSITRVLTPLRVVLPSRQVRGVPPHAPAQERFDEAGDINEWKRVAVYLEGGSAPRPEAITAVIDQKGQRFEPEIVVVPLGSTVSFPNSDPIFHNVFSLSGAREFDLGFYPAGDTRTVTFDASGVVQVYCHLHPDMTAAVVVVPNAWYAQPEDDGSFVLTGVPAGTYQLVVWHKTAGSFRQEIRIPDEGTVSVSMEIPLETGEGLP